VAVVIVQVDLLLGCGFMVNDSVEMLSRYHMYLIPKKNTLATTYAIIVERFTIKLKMIGYIVKIVDDTAKDQHALISTRRRCHYILVFLKQCKRFGAPSKAPHLGDLQ
jgi:hypothetical protein